MGRALAVGILTRRLRPHRPRRPRLHRRQDTGGHRRGRLRAAVCANSGDPGTDGAQSRLERPGAHISPARAAGRVASGRPQIPSSRARTRARACARTRARPHPCPCPHLHPCLRLRLPTPAPAPAPAHTSRPTTPVARPRPRPRPHLTTPVAEGHTPVYGGVSASRRES